MKRAAPMRRTELKPGKPIERRTRLDSRSSLPRSSPLNPVSAKTSSDRIPHAVRVAVYARSGGVCEACRTYGANHVHHRKLRSQGGRHELANLLHIHGIPCHERIHANRDGSSYPRGLLVRSTDDPALVPVVDFTVLSDVA